MNDWTEEKISEEVKRILVETLGVELDEIKSDSILIDDLGAESIDFLDISFWLEQVFGISLPTKDWAKIGDGNAEIFLSKLIDLIETKYGITISQEERLQYAKMGLKAITDRIKDTHGIEIIEDDRRMIATDGIYLMEMVLNNQFFYTLTNELRDRLIDIASNDIYSSAFGAELTKMFTVQSIINFIKGKLNGRLME